MKINKVLLLVLFVFASRALQSQNISEFLLYSFNHSMFNPAAVGVDTSHVLTLNAGISNQPYITGILNYNGSIRTGKAGVGGMVLTRGNQGLSSTKIGISYTFKFKVGENKTLNIGIRPTLKTYRVRSEYIRNYGEPRKTSPDLDLALYYTSSGFYSGISLLNTVASNNYSGYLFRSFRSFNAIIGKQIYLSKNLTIDPSLGFTNNSVDSFLSGNNNFIIRKIIILGATFASDFSNDWAYQISLNGGIKIKDRVDLIVNIIDSHHSFSYYKYYEGLLRVRI